MHLLRVPRCIRDRILPPEPITAAEKRRVLLKLNQVIENRLAAGGDDSLPLQMRNLSIADGIVTFRVAHEFEASLTLMGDGQHVPWRLLKVAILVGDKETGEGKALVHSMQVGASHPCKLTINLPLECSRENLLR